MSFKFTYGDDEFEIASQLDILELPVDAMRHLLVENGKMSQDDADNTDEVDLEGAVQILMKEMGAFQEPEPPTTDRGQAAAEGEKSPRQERREKRLEEMKADGRPLLSVPGLIIKGHKCDGTETIGSLAAMGVTKSVLQRLLWNGQIRVAHPEHMDAEQAHWDTFAESLKVVDPEAEAKRLKAIEAAKQLLRDAGIAVE